VIRFRGDLISQALRADRSLSDLLSVGDVVRVTATTANRRVGDQDDVVLAQPATLTLNSPPSPAADGTTTVTAGRGKLNVLMYRGGRVDATAECVPCAYDYTARRRRIDINVWQLTNVGYIRCLQYTYRVLVQSLGTLRDPLIVFFVKSSNVQPSAADFHNVSA